MGNRVTPWVPVCEPYVPIAERLLCRDDMEPGEIASYHRDVYAKSYVIARAGIVPICNIETQDLMIPALELATHPSTKLFQEICAPGAHQRAVERAYESQRRLIDVEAFKVIYAACPDTHHIALYGSLQSSTVREAMAILERHELVPANIVMHPETFAAFADACYDHPQLFIYTPAEYKDTRIGGLFYGVPIHLSTMFSRHHVTVTASKEFVGYLPVWGKTRKLRANEPKKLRRGDVMLYTCGFGVVNDYGISCITMNGGQPVRGRNEEVSLEDIDQTWTMSTASSTPFDKMGSAEKFEELKKHAVPEKTPPPQTVPSDTCDPADTRCMKCMVEDPDICWKGQQEEIAKSANKHKRR